MNKIDKLKALITDPVYRWDFIAYRGGFRHLGDEEFLKKKWKIFFGSKLDLEHPSTLCEKMQWLKLYNRIPKLTKMVDKYEVKQFVSQMGIPVIPTLGVWDNFHSIDFDKLPNKFVLKNTHDSGGYVVCKNKDVFDKKKAGKFLTKRLARNFYDFGREWPYKNVKPRIIAEEYIPTLGNPESVEYKVTCFNGKVDFVTICRGIPHAQLVQRKNDFYDADFNFLPFRTAYYENSGQDNKKPEQWERLLEISEMVSAGIPYARVDCYIIDGEVVFGEITFFTWSGFIHFVPEEWDLKLGQKLLLPEKVISL